VIAGVEQIDGIFSVVGMNLRAFRNALGLGTNGVSRGMTVILIFYYVHRKGCGRGVDTASDRNEYQESFLGVKTAGA
jgi:hypothetical protein